MLTRLTNTIALITLALLASVVVFVSTHDAVAQFTPEINYQGKLLDNNGVTVANGLYHMRFRLYDQATGGSLIWQEDRSTAPGNRAQVTSGLFSMMLGSSTSLTAVDFNQPLYLEVEIGGTASSTWETLSPRKRLGAVPAAFQAQQAETADTADDATTFSGLATTSFLRSDESDNFTSGTLTFDAGTSLVVNGSGTFANATATQLYATTLGINSEYFTDLTGSGLTNVGGVLTLDDSTLLTLSNWFGTTTAPHLTTLANLATVGTITSGTWQGDIVGTTYGGTGVSSFGGTNTLLYTTAANSLASLATANNGVLVTDGSGVPSIASTLPNAVQDNITRLGTIGTGVWQGTAIGGEYGGTGLGTVTQNLLLIGGAGNTWSQIATGTLGLIESRWSLLGSDVYRTAGNVGVGTSSPWAKLSVQYADGTDTGPRFVVGSSTEPNFFIGADGNIGIGTSDTWAHLTIPNTEHTDGVPALAIGSRTYGFAWPYDNIDLDIERIVTSPTLPDGRFGYQGMVSTLVASTSGNTSLEFRAGSYAAITEGPNNYSGVVRGLQIEAVHNGTGTTTNLQGLLTLARNVNTGIVTNQRAMRALAWNAVGGRVTSNIAGFFETDNSNAGGIIDDNFGVRSQLFANAGTITNNYGLYVDTPANAGTITNNYGLYLADQDVGTNAFSIYSAGGTNYLAGNLGIGTTTPNAWLTVRSSTSATGATVFNILNSSNSSLFAIDDHGTTTASNGINITSGCFAVNGTCLTTGGGSSNWTLNGGNVYRTTGFVGIATSSPGYALDVGNQARIVGAGGAVGAIDANSYALSLQNNASDVWLELLNSGGAGQGAFFGLNNNNFEQWNYQGGDIAFFTNESVSTGSERLRITNAGRVGIGTSTPLSVLSIEGSAINTLRVSATGVGHANAVFQNTTTGFGNEDGLYVGVNGGVSYLWSYQNDDLVFATDNTEQMRLTAAGRLGIGTSTPGARLDLDTGGLWVFGDIKTDASSDTLTFLGVGAGASNVVSGVGSQGLENTFIGYQSGTANATGTSNTALGYRTLLSNTTGSNNIAIGQNALQLNTTGGNNTATGYQAMQFLASGNNNSAYGFMAMRMATGGFSNTAIGYTALGFNQSPDNNTAIGHQAGLGVESVTNSSNNVFVGYQAGLGNTTGNNNILIGAQAADALTSGSNNIAIGYNIDLPSNTGSNQLTIGNLIFGTGINGTGTAISSGNIGIGTSTPLARLTVQGATGFSDLFQIASSTNDILLAIDYRGWLGIGTSSPQSIVHITGDNATTTIDTNVVVGGGALSYNQSTGQTNITNLNLGTMRFEADAGRITWVDMPIVNAATGTPMAYSAQIDGTNILTVYGESNGEGGLRLPAVGVGSSTPFALLSVQGIGATTRPLFAIASSTGEVLALLDHRGYLGLGTSTPTSVLSIVGDIFASSSATSTFTGNLHVYNQLQVGTSSTYIVGNATSTFGGGINITGSGCFAVGGTCLTAGGASALNDLSDVNATAAFGNLIYYDGGQWTHIATGTLGFTESRWLLSGSDVYRTTGNIGIGTSSPLARLTVQGATGFSNLFQLASSTDDILVTVDYKGYLGLGTTTPRSRLSMGSSGTGAESRIGIDQLFTVNPSGGGTQYVNALEITNAPTGSSNTLVGSLLRVTDNTSLANTVRALEVQAERGDNVLGENTAISGFGRTFGVRAVTEGDAGGTFSPAGLFAQSNGVTQGNVIRGFTNSLESAEMLYLFHNSSDFASTVFRANMAVGSGSFTGNFLDLQIGGTSKFTVTAHGTTTIGDGVTQAGLQILNGGLCVDWDGCVASTSGAIAARDLYLGDSDLAEYYFSNTLLVPGDIVMATGGITIDRAARTSSDRIMGVVSTKPGITLGTSAKVPNMGRYPIGLAGRLPVKVSTENGPIAVGDRIVLSSIDGVGMRDSGGGGTVVGIALESFDVGSSYYSPEVVRMHADAVPHSSLDPSRVSDTVASTRMDGGSQLGERDQGGAYESVRAPQASTQVSAGPSLDLNRSAERMTTKNGERVAVGQVMLFINLGVDSVGVFADYVDGEHRPTPFFVELVQKAIGLFESLTTRRVIVENDIQARELCLDGVCITGSELSELLELRNSAGASQSGGGSSGSSQGAQPSPPSSPSESDEPDAKLSEDDEVEPEAEPFEEREDTIEKTPVSAEDEHAPEVVEDDTDDFIESQQQDEPTEAADDTDVE